MSSGISEYRGSPRSAPLLRNGIAAERDLPKPAAQQPQAVRQIEEDLETIFVDRRDSAAGSALVSATSSQGLDGTSPPAPLLSPRGFSERVPPEWAVLLLGCALGLATGASVVLFNLAVHGIHNLAWAGTPAEGAAWLRVQPLATTWHRIMLIPVMGGIVVGMLHALTGILDQSYAATPTSLGTSNPHAWPGSQPSKVDWSVVWKPSMKAVQAAVTLGTGSSLGPEGPSVDIGKAWADGMSEILVISKERKLALMAAGAAAGISSGFNAAVAGCFFAIETVLQSVASENAPPLTTAMIILASVLSSTVSNVVLGEQPAFTVPAYELKSAAELPLYLLLGMVCGVISVIFTRLIKWSSALFDFLRDRLGIPPAVTPALGGLCVGFIALRYPGVLYWGFSNVNEILHSRESASAPGPRLITQLVAAKLVATALCRGSGLVGGIYAPSLFIGSAVGSVYGSLAGAAINAAVPGKAEVAAPQAYALVGMAAMLASACSVPLTSVLLLFELTKDYRILLPLMGAVGLAYWVSSVANRKRPPKMSAYAAALYSPLSTSHSLGLQMSAPRHRASRADEPDLAALQAVLGPDAVSEEDLMDELLVSAAMSTTFVSLSASTTVKEALGALVGARTACALVVDQDGLLEGVLTLADVQREVLRVASGRRVSAASVGGGEDEGALLGLDVQDTLVGALCTGRVQTTESELVVCYPDMTLRSAHRLMAPRDLQQAPVVSRTGKRWQDRGRKVVGLLDVDAMRITCQAEAMRRMLESCGFALPGPSRLSGSTSGGH